MKPTIQTLTVFCLASIINLSVAQQSSGTCYSSIKAFDLSKLWKDHTISLEGNGDKIAFPEPLGFIGDNYQRFYIHYTSIQKDLSNPYRYIVSGKIRVKNTVCSFTGIITVIEANGLKTSHTDYKQGNVICLVKLNEDASSAESGFIKGKLTTRFFIDKQGKIHYDTLDSVSDSFSNNDFEGVWTGYKTKQHKRCNWGDFRIPQSGDLDSGAGEFRVSDQYINNGWQSYMNQYTLKTTEARNAKLEESRKWWQ